MSYDLYLRDPVTKKELQVPGHMMYGGNVACTVIDGRLVPTTTTEAYLNITYNYSKYYYEAFPSKEDNQEQYAKDASEFSIVSTEGGIRSLNGMFGANAIPFLHEMIRRITRKYQSDDGNWLITKREEKYWVNRSTGERKEYPEVLTEYLRLSTKYKSGEEASQKMDEKYESKTEIIEIDEGGSGDSYWTATAANAIKPMYQLIALSQMRPDGVWSEES